MNTKQSSFNELILSKISSNKFACKPLYFHLSLIQDLPKEVMASKDNTSKTSNDTYTRLIIRGHSKETQQFEEEQILEIVNNR